MQSSFNNPGNRPKCWVCSQKAGKEVQVGIFQSMDDVLNNAYVFVAMCHGQTEYVTIPAFDLVACHDPRKDFRFDGWAFKPKDSINDGKTAGGGSDVVTRG